jgi:endonuclease/exonuclease/phosphatase (EEP) superfamily protein YafD
MNSEDVNYNPDDLEKLPLPSRWELFIDWLTPRVLLCQLLVLLAMGLSFAASKYWWADLFSHFYFQYFWASGLTLIYACLIKSKKLIFVAVGSIAIAYTVMMHSLWLYPRTLPVEAEIPESAPSFRVAHINTLLVNENTSGLDSLIASQAPDIINIQEANFSVFEYVSKKLKAQYPYQFHDPRNDPYGIIILSKKPIVKVTPIPVQGVDYKTKFYKVEVEIARGIRADIFSIHTFQPLKGLSGTEHRNLELIAATEELKKSRNSALLIGDLNITPYSPFFRNHVIRRSGFQFLGQGKWPLSPTWPNFLKVRPFQIPIDHMLYDPHAFAVQGWETFTYEGSDHKGIIADFAYIK